MSAIPSTHSTGFSVINPRDIYWAERNRRPDSSAVISHITTLKDSIEEFGIIQPVVLFFDPANDNRPTGVAGWCRTQASIALGLDSVPFVKREELPTDQAKALELEENLRRLDPTWQEYVLGINDTHKLKVKLAASDCKSWGQRQTGTLLKMKASQINTAIKLAEAMLTGNQAVIQASNIDEAEKILLASQQDMITNLLAAKAGVKISISSATKLTKNKKSGPIAQPSEPDNDPNPVSIDPTLFADLMPSRSKSEQNAEKPGPQRHEVELSKMLFNVDCHEWFAQAQPESIDLIYTDIPFGIDMANLEDIDGIEVVRDSHQVEENIEQMPEFLQGAFRVLKNNSYLLFFYDVKHQEKLCGGHLWEEDSNGWPIKGTFKERKGWIEKAGFKFQTWPVVWIKTHACKNNAPQYNWTKATEYVMACRKGSPTLRKPQMLNYIAANGKAEKQAQRNPFAKPFDFSRQLLDPVILPGMTVLDCYAGGGSLLRACINLGCRVIGLEKDSAQFPHLQESIRATFKGMLRGEVEFT